ncbi:MAG: hypothetical protein K2O60_07630 [Ruminococcus sp.]|nr:hypothetical protein [Ruminococcus sp.]
MPDILFEGKRKDNGEWIEGSLLNFRENTYIIPHDSEYCYDDTEKFAFDVEYFEVIPETVRLMIGKEIYDIASKIENDDPFSYNEKLKLIFMLGELAGYKSKETKNRIYRHNHGGDESE